VWLRTQYGIERLAPGLTGWAQINGRDGISIQDKVQLDSYYLNNISWRFDLKIILLTIYYAMAQVGVSH
jgi:O-antigen biosynthesis protein WbqP